MRTSIIILIVLVLPFFLGFTDLSYGSMVTESNQDMRVATRDAIFMDDEGKIEIIEMPKIPKSSSSFQENNRLRILWVKEKIITPEIAVAGYGDVTEILFLLNPPLSPAFYPIDFNFVEEMKYEKQFIRHLMY